jgi:hypothetical protein
MEVIGSGKHSSLLRYGNNYCRKSFIVQAPGEAKKKDQTMFFCGFFLQSFEEVLLVSFLDKENNENSFSKVSQFLSTSYLCRIGRTLKGENIF